LSFWQRAVSIEIRRAVKPAAAAADAAAEIVSAVVPGRKKNNVCHKASVHPLVRKGIFLRLFE